MFVVKMEIEGVVISIVCFCLSRDFAIELTSLLNDFSGSSLLPNIYYYEEV